MELPNPMRGQPLLVNFLGLKVWEKWHLHGLQNYFMHLLKQLVMSKVTSLWVCGRNEIEMTHVLNFSQNFNGEGRNDRGTMFALEWYWFMDIKMKKFYFCSRDWL